MPVALPRIQKLSKAIASQIAAGEVVERPASVIKELLENSLDAGATSIEISIEKGGMRLIRVRDDGCGIAKDDLLLATAQHATSKIRELNDLEHISSLGFRGEALASIASVSELSIISHAENQYDAFQLTSEQEIKPANHPIGTTIEVRDLFVHVPVRRKFLKSERTEFHRIEDVVRQIMLSRFDVACKLVHNERTVFQVKSCEYDQYHLRLSQLVSKGFIEKSIPIDEQRHQLRLTGWLAANDYLRAHADQQYFFVNGRMVRDKLISHAMRTALADYVPKGQFAAYVLFLELPAQDVDVNVHPTKHEVRFQQPRLIHDFVEQSIRRMFQVSDNEPLEYSSVNHEALQVEQDRRPYQVEKKVTSEKLEIQVVLEQRWILFTWQDNTYLADYLQIRNWQYLQLDTGIKRLLFPVNVDLSAQQMSTFVDIQDALAQKGFSIRINSDKQITVLEIPDCFAENSLNKLMIALCTHGAAEMKWMDYLVLAEPTQRYEIGLWLQSMLKQHRSTLLNSRWMKAMTTEDWQRLLA